MSLLELDTPAAARLMRAARGLRRAEDAWVLAYYPVARLNPFQTLLYGRGWAARFAPVPLGRVTDIRALPGVLSFGVGAALHLHWLSGITGQARTAEEAREMAGAFAAELRDLKQHHVDLVWTVHNRLPHESRFPDMDAELRAEVADLADAIHVLEADTAAQVSDVFPVPEYRVLHVPHPSYVGVYSTHYDRSSVRFDLGFDDDDLVVGMVGLIRPYKGIDLLLEAVSDPAVRDERLVTVVAGMPGADPESAALAEQLRQSATIRSVTHELDDQTLARLMSALDVMVLPYRASLNSGAALLALSFGVPLVAPRMGPFRSLIDERLCLGYDPGDPRGLATALGAARVWIKGLDRDAVRRYLEPLSPAVVSERFFRELRPLLSRAAAARRSASAQPAPVLSPRDGASADADGGRTMATAGRPASEG